MGNISVSELCQIFDVSEMTIRRDLNDLKKQGHLQRRYGGGDYGVVRSFFAAQRGEADALTNARESLESHLMDFATEESRMKDTVVDMADFRQREKEL